MVFEMLARFFRRRMLGKSALDAIDNTLEFQASCSDGRTLEIPLELMRELSSSVIMPVAEMENLTLVEFCSNQERFQDYLARMKRDYGEEAANALLDTARQAQVSGQGIVFPERTGLKRGNYRVTYNHKTGIGIAFAVAPAAASAA